MAGFIVKSRLSVFTMIAESSMSSGQIRAACRWFIGGLR
jgi:hypothetical protein